ncbi:MAG: hypothetical protein ACLPUO_26285 [Streptosporangiaceae bacterium]
MHESLAAARRSRRRQQQRLMYWLLTGATMVALLVEVFLVRDISGTTPVAGPAARAASAPAASSASSATSTGPRVSPRRKVSLSLGTSSVSRSEVTDATSGLSYRSLPWPWSPGCPYQLNTPLFSWSAGEGVLAGEVTIGGNGTLWYGDACSGQFQQQFQYSGTADLEPAAMSLAAELEVDYYSGLVHYSTIEGSSAMQVSGHQAWVVRFLITYPGAASEGLAWTSEVGAVVLVDTGAGQVPAVFYVSVPSTLGIGNVGTLISSLRLGG